MPASSISVNKAPVQIEKERRKLDFFCLISAGVMKDGPQRCWQMGRSFKYTSLSLASRCNRKKTAVENKIKPCVSGFRTLATTPVRHSRLEYCGRLRAL